MTSPVRFAAHWVIRAYQLTLSGLIGRQCRHAPSCSEYADEAIGRHGLWAGGFMGLARICRCNPWGTEGFDPVPQIVPEDARWWRPWRYGLWRSMTPVPQSPVDTTKHHDRAINSTARP